MSAIWIRVLHEDHFIGLQIASNLREKIDKLMVAKPDILGEIFINYIKYRDYEVEVTQKLGGVSRGTTIIATFDALLTYFNYIDDIESIFADEVFIEDISLINGSEILDMLNHELEHNDLLLDSIRGPLTFSQQYIDDDTYTLEFNAFYNNWGTLQPTDNFINIETKRVTVGLSEQDEGAGYEEPLERILIDWLKNHRFDTLYEDEFNRLIRDVYERLPQLTINSKEGMNKVIELLTKAKTHMK